MQKSKTISKRKRSLVRKTQKNKIGGKKNGLENIQKSKIVHIFLEMLNTIKLYHWKTYSYSQHKATDELYSKLNEHIDSFVEIMLGKDASRVKLIEKRAYLVDLSNVKDLKDKIFEFRDFLIDLSNILDAKKDTDLLNIRDEILGNINQFLYLLTLHL